MSSTPAPTVQSVAFDAVETFGKFTAPVLILALANHFHGQTVNVSAVYQAAYAGAAAAAAVLYHGVPALLTVKQTKSVAAAEAQIKAIAAQVEADLAASKPATPPAV